MADLRDLKTGVEESSRTLVPTRWLRLCRQKGQVGDVAKLAIEIISEAQYTDRARGWNAYIIHMRRGQSIISVRQLSKRLGKKRETINRHLQILHAVLGWKVEALRHGDPRLLSPTDDSGQLGLPTGPGGHRSGHPGDGPMGHRSGHLAGSPIPYPTGHVGVLISISDFDRIDRPWLDAGGGPISEVGGHRSGHPGGGPMGHRSGHRSGHIPLRGSPSRTPSGISPLTPPREDEGGQPETEEDPPEKRPPATVEDLRMNASEALLKGQREAVVESLHYINTDAARQVLGEIERGEL